jgi:predicted enzyme related to lactoylglutathione lyase
MISHVQIVTICVSDQDRAKVFYTETLGMELIADQMFGEGTRWLTVAPKGAKTHIVLYTPPGMEDRIGTSTGMVFGAEDVQATCDDLAAKGVEFIRLPETQPWGGLMAEFKDPGGNQFVMHD